ncbi:MAG TPA: T9SS type A sorting domain-containing protein [Candidatus Krumholzibacteria bacterium]|nr:T9SS type A sorting domain-containing protein [Candidatus Krumholzibacteria bacterium]
MRFRRVSALLPLLLLLGAAAAARPPQPVDLDLERVTNLSGHERFDGAADSPAATTGLWRQLVFEMRLASAAPAELPTARDLQRRALAQAAPQEIPVGLLDVTTVDGRRLAAAGALRPRTWHGDAAVLTFSPDWILGDAPRDLAVDSGHGWRPVPADGRLPAAFPSRGERTVRVRWTGADGAPVHAAFTLDVAAVAAPAPDDTLHVTASIPYGGAAGGGKAYVALAPGHASVTNPVIVVEGFDLDDSLDWDPLYELLNQEGLIESLRAEGFDAVVLDFDEATAPIQRNAFVLTELIGMVEAMTAPAQTSVVIGASMGGLVSRYALGWLESQGPGHRVRTWISFDSPQRGAVIPLGLQHWLDFFSGDSEDAAFLLSRLDTPAARQMLLHHHSATSGVSAGPAALRADFLADLAAVGLPSCRRVAAANGSGLQADQGFGPGAQLVRYEYRSFLVDITGNVWAVPDQTQTRIFQGEKNLIWPLPDEYQDVNVAGTLPLDGAPGGFRLSLAQMDTTSVPYGDIQALHQAHCFIPVISALDLDATDPFAPVLTDPDLLSHTSFDAVYAPPENQEHIAITPASAAWFLDEIRDPSTAVAALPSPPTTLQAWPNPFNPSTTIRFTTTAPGPVTLTAYDLRGRQLATLLNDVLATGEHEHPWHPHLPSGSYLLRLQTPTNEQSTRVLLLE